MLVEYLLIAILEKVRFPWYIRNRERFLERCRSHENILKANHAPKICTEETTAKSRRDRH